MKAASRLAPKAPTAVEPQEVRGDPERREPAGIATARRFALAASTAAYGTAAPGSWASPGSIDRCPATGSKLQLRSHPTRSVSVHRFCVSSINRDAVGAGRTARRPRPSASRGEPITVVTPAQRPGVARHDSLRAASTLGTLTTHVTSNARSRHARSARRLAHPRVRAACRLCPILRAQRPQRTG